MIKLLDILAIVQKPTASQQNMNGIITIVIIVILVLIISTFFFNKK